MRTPRTAWLAISPFAACALDEKPSRFPETLSRGERSHIWRLREEDTRELREGLWQIRRRGGLLERIDWVYLPRSAQRGRRPAGGEKADRLGRPCCGTLLP